LVEAGRMQPGPYFELVDKVAADDERALWDQIIRNFGRIDVLERGRPGRDAFRAYARAHLRRAFDRLGWDPVPGEPEDDTILRARLIRTLGDFGDPAIVVEAKRRFAAFVRDPATLPGSLREPVIHLAGRTADAATYETLHTLARRTTVTEERGRYYGALAAALDPALAQRTLELALSDVPPNVASRLIFGVAGSEHPDLAWAFVQQHFPVLLERHGSSFRDYVAGAVLTNFTDRTAADELARFEPARATAGGRISAARATETILINADFRERQLPAIDEWVKGHGGA
jgi:ERAP1-like C-terminal domain